MIKKLVAVTLLAILIWGAYSLYSVLTSPPKLTARWGTVTAETTEILLSGEWNTSPYIPASIDGIDLKLMEENIGSAENITIGKNVTAVIRIDNGNLVDALFKYLDNGQRGTLEVTVREKLFGFVGLTFSMKREVSVDVLGKLNFTAESKPILGGIAYSPELLGTKVSWGGQRGGRGIFIVDMDFYNPNSFPIPLSNLSFDLYANGVKVGTGYLPKSTVIPARGYARVRAVVGLDKDALPEAWALHVRNGEVSRVTAKMKLSLKVLGRRVEIPLPPIEQTVKTNALEYVNEALSKLARR